MRYPRKKGSLQLSINAIVILIMAITILGIGLGFIRSQWTKLQDDMDDVSKEIKNQIIDQIRESGKILSFNNVDIQIQKGKEDKFYFGVKNTYGQERKFGFVIECVQKQKDSSTTDCDETVYGGMGLGGESWFPSFFPTANIPAGEVKVMPITMQIPNADPDTYEMEFRVYAGDDTGGDPDPDDETTIVAQETFYITVK